MRKQLIVFLSLMLVLTLTTPVLASDLDWFNAEGIDEMEFTSAEVTEVEECANEIGNFMLECLPQWFIDVMDEMEFTPAEEETTTEETEDPTENPTEDPENP
tara:strand:+ start:255 stop:560 length:306 start_codon:yes stop_codon:yes gene_type:complete